MPFALPFFNSDPSEVEPIEITATSVKFKVTKVGNNALGIVIAYRDRKCRNAVAFSYSNELLSPAIDDTIEITGLTEGNWYEMIAYSTDGAGNLDSEPGPFMFIIAATPKTNVRDLSAALKTILISDLNTELLAVGAERGETYKPFRDDAIFDVSVPVGIKDPLVEIGPQSSTVEKYGNRKYWDDIIYVAVSKEGAEGDADQLQRDVEAYMEAIENIIDRYDTMGGITWEAEVIEKLYPPLTEEGEDNMLTASGVIIIKNIQTN